MEYKDVFEPIIIDCPDCGKPNSVHTYINTMTGDLDFRLCDDCEDELDCTGKFPYNI